MTNISCFSDFTFLYIHGPLIVPYIIAIDLKIKRVLQAKKKKKKKIIIIIIIIIITL